MSPVDANVIRRYLLRSHISFLLFFMLLLTAVSSSAVAGTLPDPSAPIPHSAAPVTVLNRTVLIFRVPVLGVTPVERAERAEETLRKLLDKGGKGVASFQAIPQGYAIMLDGVLAFVMVPGDADPLTQETPLTTAQNTVAALEVVVREHNEAKNLSLMLRAAGIGATATLLLLLVCWLLHHIRTWVVTRLTGVAHAYSERFSVGGGAILQRDRIFLLVKRGITLMSWLLTVLLIFNWIGFILARFPYTRPWGEQLTEYLVTGALDITHEVIRSIPGLAVALLIFLVAKFAINLIGSFLERIEQGEFEFAGLDRDTVIPTRRLISMAIWLFAVVMAYPYLPGSETAAFKGLTVLVGLMISLGGSSLVGQAASGLILVYTRTLRPGEYVQIGATKGTVVELGLFATRIHTGMGEELTLPNSLILGNITRNYSRMTQGRGYMLDITISCGYDTPWRQVEAMLVAAALRTHGVLQQPPPRVFQVALVDFYIEYRLVCQAHPDEPHLRAELLNTLHASILDVFNEQGIQIMSPHYITDPETPKVVPKERWYPPPVNNTPTFTL